MHNLRWLDPVPERDTTLMRNTACINTASMFDLLLVLRLLGLATASDWLCTPREVFYVNRLLCSNWSAIALLREETELHYKCVRMASSVRWIFLILSGRKRRVRPRIAGTIVKESHRCKLEKRVKRAKPYLAMNATSSDTIFTKPRLNRRSLYLLSAVKFWQRLTVLFIKQNTSRDVKVLASYTS
jgi:hypothetical protein